MPVAKRKIASDLDYGVAIYHERLNWSIWVWVFAIFMTGSVSLSVWAALGNDAAIAISLIQFGLLIYAAQKSALEIRVTKGWLLVGPAAIERAFIHNFKALEPAEFKRVRGVDADPACYLQIRFWVNSAIKIDLRDPKDKTPYWLISTNRANDLAKILNVADH
ncbi:MAG: DUF3093 family protein [Actinobacteria bacterium]|uniref:Unannotated protein n=1 Tax=freshwater metagenome TaxID=449393 RepID=A0A6J6BX53_9ZZZZ|nr:DUF3093 family protein [Actinomycetota bacterium]